MERKTNAKKVSMYFFSLALMAFGIVISTKAYLGTSPTGTIPFVTSMASGLSLGTTTLIFDLFFFLACFFYTGKNVTKTFLFSLVSLALFSGLNDVFAWMLCFDAPDEYAFQWIFIALSIIFRGIGISMLVLSDVTMLPTDYFVNYTSKYFKIQYGYVKIIFDVILITTAGTLSMFFFGELRGVREGTVVIAICVGTSIRIFMHLFERIGFVEWINS